MFCEYFFYLIFIPVSMINLNEIKSIIVNTNYSHLIIKSVIVIQTNLEILKIEHLH